jgi:tyrosine-protein phosphatase SIW14
VALLPQCRNVALFNRMDQMNRRTIVITGFLAVVSLIAGTQVSWCQTEKEPRGVPNFGFVTDNLYRGGQPTSDGFNALHAMGVEIVVDLREKASEVATEKRQVESFGMKSVGIPWSANHEPSSTQIVEFLDLVRANPDTKIFVHCRRGADRTGVMIAAYRIAVEHKPVAEAVSEMHRYHYDWLFLPQLKRYVGSLPGLVQNDPQFANYRPQPSGSNRYASKPQAFDRDDTGARNPSN